jgi:hypothetical protein
MLPKKLCSQLTTQLRRGSATGDFVHNISTRATNNILPAKPRKEGANEHLTKHIKLTNETK